MIETYRGVVYPIHLDHMGHMNVQWYTARFDEATWHLFSRIGITNGYVRESGMGMAAVHQSIDYRQEAVAGDLLVITSAVDSIKEKAIHFHHRMHNAETGEKLADSRLIGVHFDRKNRRACPFPPAVVAASKALVDRGSAEQEHPNRV